MNVNPWFVFLAGMFCGGMIMLAFYLWSSRSPLKRTSRAVDAKTPLR